MTKLSSLRTRLAVGGVLVAALAVLVTAVAVQRLTESDIRSSIQRDLDAELFIRDSLAFYAFEHGGWVGVASEVETVARDTGERVAVATLSGEILADSELLLFSSEAPLPNQAFIVDPDSSLFGFSLEPEDQEFIGLQNQLTLVCLDQLEIGSSTIFDDQFGIEIVAPSRELSLAEENQLLTCMADAGVEDLDLFGDPELRFDEDGQFEGTTGLIEPLQLFVGYGDEGAGSVFPSLRSGRFWVAVAAVLALSAAVAAWVAARIARPIGSLTGAAQKMSAGDLATRVGVERSDEIGQLGQAFNEMASSLQAQDQARRTLTTDVAHELRSPLANIKGYLEAIQDGIVQPDSATIDSLHEEAEALQVLIEDLQQLSLAEAGGLSLHRVPTDIAQLVESVVASHQATAAAAQVVLSANGRQGTELLIDPDRVRQVLTNLVSNALRHTGPGDTVAVTVETGPEWVNVKVSDSGEGIATEHLAHIFDRFYRADPARARSTGGSGLGLAIAQALVRAHDGTIEATSQLGVCTTFTVRLRR